MRNERPWVSLAFFSFLFCFSLFLVPFSACEPAKPKAECSINSDCKNNQICVKDKCQNRGDVGDACTTVTDCLERSTDKNIPLLCEEGKCREKCQTSFDCDDPKTQICEISTGRCLSKNDGGEETVPEEGPTIQEGGDCSPPTARCAQGLSCVEQDAGAQKKKACLAACTDSSTCKGGRLCVGGFCVPYGETCSYTDSTGKTLNQPCWKGLECLRETSPVEGNCYLPCSQPTECGGGSLTCVDTVAGKKHCRQPSKQANPGEPCGMIGAEQIGCTQGHDCIPERTGSSTKVCTKLCTKAEDCAFPRFCNNGFCVVGDVGDAKLGEACKVTGATQAEKCGAGLYCLLFQQAQQGLCYNDCADPRATCTAGTTCAALNATNKICLKTCTQATDCTAPLDACGTLQQGGPSYCVHK